MAACPRRSLEEFGLCRLERDEVLQVTADRWPVIGGGVQLQADEIVAAGDPDDEAAEILSCETILEPGRQAEVQERLRADIEPVVGERVGESDLMHGTTERIRELAYSAQSAGPDFTDHIRVSRRPLHQPSEQEASPADEDDLVVLVPGVKDGPERIQYLAKLTPCQLSRHGSTIRVTSGKSTTRHENVSFLLLPQQ